MASDGKEGPNGSGGATSSASRTESAVRAAQCTTCKQPRLCATRATSGPDAATARSRAVTQSAHTGRLQSRAGTRRASGRRPSQAVCQWPSGEPWIPGRIRMGGKSPSFAMRFADDSASRPPGGGPDVPREARQGMPPHPPSKRSRFVRSQAVARTSKCSRAPRIRSSAASSLMRSASPAVSRVRAHGAP